MNDDIFNVISANWLLKIKESRLKCCSYSKFQGKTKDEQFNEALIFQNLDIVLKLLSDIKKHSTMIRPDDDPVCPKYRRVQIADSAASKVVAHTIIRLICYLIQ